MKNITITDAIQYAGVDDKAIDLFESQYVVPNGVSYNSYVIMDDKIAVMDSVDARAGKVMKESLSQMKEITILEPMVTIKSTLNEASEAQLEQLAQALL